MEGEGVINSNPLFVNSDSSNFSIIPNSAVIDKGIAYYSVNDTVIVNMQQDDYLGKAPDIGYYEIEGIITTPYFEQVTDGVEVNDNKKSTGCNWVDYDNDGDLDLFVTNFAQANDLYINDGQGNFTKLTEGEIVIDTENSVDATWGDFNNDGNIDVFVVNDKQRNSLYMNLGNGKFEKILQNEEVTEDSMTSCAAWGDFNSDGKLDLFVGMGNDMDYFFEMGDTKNEKLYINNGNEIFNSLQATNYNYNIITRSCSWGDFENDGFPEVIVSGPDIIIKFDQNESTKYWNFNYTAGKSYSVSIGDYNNDGSLDIFLANNYSYYELNYTPKKNELLMNDQQGNFISAPKSSIVTDEEFSSGSAWGDFDNDGDIDLYVTNGNVYSNINSINSFYKNNGDGTFTKLTSTQEMGEIVAVTGKYNSCSWGDFDNDGDIDLYITSRVGKNILFKNNADKMTNNNWINIKCIGSQTNKSAIGTKVRVKANIFGKPTWQMREISSQTGRSSQNALNASFGLGDASIIDTIVVEWIKGYKEYYTNVAANQFLEIKEKVITTPFFERITEGSVVNDSKASTGCNWVDYDNDGDLDLFVTNFGQANDLYVNDGQGNFTKLTEGEIVTDTEYSVDATWGDFNNDGKIDVFVVNDNQRNSFYMNLGNGNFKKVLQDEEITGDTTSSCAAWGDYNNDGFLDLFVGMGVDSYSAYIHINILNHKLNHKLYINTGNGSFTSFPVTIKDIDSYYDLKSCQWSDLNNDGFSDLVVASGNWPLGSENAIILNERDSSFISSQIGGSKITYSTSIGDYNNDGYPDIFFANYYWTSPEGQRSFPENNQLYLNNKSGEFSQIQDSPIATDEEYSVGSSWGDFDNDGDLDLFVVNGGDYVILNEGNYSSVSSLYQNNGDGTFTKLTSAQEMGEIVAITGLNNSCCWGDFDNDGDIDLYITNREGKNILLKNIADKMTNNNWINIKCIGSQTNKSAIGTKIRVKANISGKPVWQMREISSQTGRASQNALNASFGLGDASIIDTIEVDWIKGNKKYYTNVNTNQFLEIKENSDTIDSTKYIPKKFLLSQNYPNPFNSGTVITYQVPTQSFVNIRVYNCLGEQVAEIVNEEKPMGTYFINFNPSQLASGVYYYRMQSGDFTETKKFILLK